MKTVLCTLMLILSIYTSAQEKPIEVISKSMEGKVKIFAVNNTPLVYSARFKVTGSGCKPTKKVPLTLVLEPNSKVELYDLLPIKNKEWKCGTNSRYTIGNVKAKPNHRFVYDLPYAKGSAFFITQGYYGTFSHQNKYALDFTMPEGTPIHAIRGGTVVKLKKDSDSGCPTIECQKDVNYIWIAHKDGTIAEYAHLKLNGTDLKIGDIVKKGDKIGLSGNTGFSQAPHLHLEVFIPQIGDKRKTIQTKFNNGTSKAVILKKGNNIIKS